jgi:hypothetical protein
LELARKAPAGIFIEVGVNKGGTAFYLNEIVKKRGYEFWLFDTFEGMPESTEGLDSHPVGDFADCSYETVRKLIPNAQIFKGFFPETLPSHIPPIAFAHIDCDQYESIKQCIIRLMPYLADGGIMYFDDYGCLAGATKAIDEFCPYRAILENGKAYYIKR